MHWETKKIRWLTLLQYPLYYPGLELNSQFSWGMPVVQVRDGGLGYGDVLEMQAIYSRSWMGN